MKPIEEIKTIDRKLSLVLRHFDSKARRLRFKVICDLADEKVIKEQRYPGIYRIEIKNDGTHKDFLSWVKAFRVAWADKRYLKKFTPNIKQKRVDKHKTLKKWIPLYVGKAHCVGDRVFEHINLDLKKPTTAMKLKARENMRNHKFRLSTIEIEVDNYDLIVPIVERVQRDKINPILGRQ